MEINKYAILCLNKEIKMFIILSLSIRRQNKCYDYENNNKSRQQQKFSGKVQESVEAF